MLLATFTEQEVGKIDVTNVALGQSWEIHHHVSSTEKRKHIAVCQRHACLCPQKHIALTREFHIPAKQTATGNLKL